MYLPNLQRPKPVHLYYARFAAVHAAASRLFNFKGYPSEFNPADHTSVHTSDMDGVRKLEYCPFDSTNQGRDEKTLQCTMACSATEAAARALEQTGQTCTECISNNRQFHTDICKAVSSTTLTAADGGDTCDQWCCCGNHGYFLDEEHGGSAATAHLVRCYPTYLKASCSDKSGDGDISYDPVTDEDCGHLEKWHDPHHTGKHGSHHASHHGKDGWHGKHGWHTWEEEEWQTGHLDWVTHADMEGEDHGSDHGSYKGGKHGYLDYHHDYSHDYSHGKYNAKHHGKHHGKHHHHHHHWHYHAKPLNSAAAWVPAVPVVGPILKVTQGYYEDSPFCDDPNGCDTNFDVGIDWLKCKIRFTQ